MMRDKLKTYLLSVTMLFMPIMPLNGAFGVGPSIVGMLDIKTAVEGIFEQEKPIVEVQDPEILAKMEKLSLCESNNREDVVIVDTNGYRSYGKFMFQLATFRQFAEQYELITKGLTNDELRPLLLDGELQSKLVYEMLENDPTAIGHWRNCANKHGLWE